MIEKKLEDSGCGTPVDSGIHFFLIFLLSLLSRLWTVQDLIVLVNTLLEVTISFLELTLYPQSLRHDCQGCTPRMPWRKGKRIICNKKTIK